MSVPAVQLAEQYCWHCSHGEWRHGVWLTTHVRAYCLEPACSCERFVGDRELAELAQIASSDADAVVDLVVEPYFCWCGNALRDEEWHSRDCPYYAEWRAWLDGDDE
jgi:hypothetical protein